MNVPLRLPSLLLGLAAALLLQACAPKPQNIRLDPPVHAPSATNVGQGKVVWLDVKDARPSKTLGIVGDPGGRYAHVSIEDDFSKAVYQRVSGVLLDMGFMVQPTPTTSSEGRSLMVEVREIKYQSPKSTLTFDTEVNVAVAAMAQNGADHYNRIYNAGEKRTSPLMPDAEENASAVNKAVAATLEDMLNDSHLVELLAR